MAPRLLVVWAVALLCAGAIVGAHAQNATDPSGPANSTAPAAVPPPPPPPAAVAAPPAQAPAKSNNMTRAEAHEFFKNLTDKSEYYKIMRSFRSERRAIHAKRKQNVKDAQARAQSLIDRAQRTHDRRVKLAKRELEKDAKKAAGALGKSVKSLKKQLRKDKSRAEDELDDTIDRIKDEKKRLKRQEKRRMKGVIKKASRTRKSTITAAEDDYERALDKLYAATDRALDSIKKSLRAAKTDEEKRALKKSKQEIKVKARAKKRQLKRLRNLTIRQAKASYENQVARSEKEYDTNVIQFGVLAQQKIAQAREAWKKKVADFVTKLKTDVHRRRNKSTGANRNARARFALATKSARAELRRIVKHAQDMQLKAIREAKKQEAHQMKIVNDLMWKALTAAAERIKAAQNQ